MAQSEKEALTNGEDLPNLSGGHNNNNEKPRRINNFSKQALQRRKTLHDAQAKAQARLQRKDRLQKGWKSARNMVQKLNVGKWIDDLEKDQELAYQLEDLNAELQQEVERKELVIAVRESCMDAIREHLRSFLEERSDGTYEEWIAELHPDNYDEIKQTVDARFYIQDSDHRLLWNQQHEDRSDDNNKIVPPRNIEQLGMTVVKNPDIES